MDALEDLLGLVYVGPEQCVPVLAAFVLWIGLAGIGSVVAGRDRIVEANVFFGWAAVSIVFTLVGAFTRGSFGMLAVAFAAVALIGIVLAWRRGDSLFVAGAWRVGVLAIPLMLIAGAMAPSQWDEFSHWLPAARFLFETDGFPRAGDVFTGLSAYPYGWPILMYLGSRTAGHYLDNIGGPLNILMLMTFGVFALRTAFAVAGKPRGAVIGWPFAAAVALVATVFNPTFVQKIALTAYSDVSGSVATGVAILVGYIWLERIAGRAQASSLGGAQASSLGGAWQFSLALALLINIRQTNLVFVLAILLAVTLIAWRDGRIGLARYARQLPLVVLAPAALYLVWRWYVAGPLGGGVEATLRPLSQWDFSLIPLIALAMAKVAVKKIAFFAPMLLACFFAARALLRCRSGLDRISLLVAAVFAANLALLLVTYLGHFGRGQAVTAGYFWRYNIDIGMAAVVFITIGALWFWRERDSFDTYPRFLAPVSIALVLVLPLVFAPKLRFDLEPPKPHYVAVAKDLAPHAAELINVSVADPLGTGEAGVITRYYLDRPGREWLSGIEADNPEPRRVAAFLAAIPPGQHLLVHSLTPGLAEALGQVLDARTSYLIRRDAGGWTLLRDWAKPSDHPY